MSKDVRVRIPPPGPLYILGDIMPSTKEILYGSCFGCAHYDVCEHKHGVSKMLKEFADEKKKITMNIPYPFRVVLICDKWMED